MIIFAYILSVTGMLLVPIALAILLRRRFHVPWILFTVGALTFIGSQVVHLPLNSLLTRIGLLPASADVPFPLWQSSLTFGLTAGLCEELARAVGYLLLKKARRFQDGMMLGLGHGGIECMAIGGVLTAATVSSLFPMIGKDLTTMNLLPEQIEALSKQLAALSSSAWLAALPLLERCMAIILHVSLSMMVLRAFQRHNALYVVMAIGYHAAADAILVYISSNTQNMAVIYGALLAILLPGLAWLWYVWPKKREARPAGQLSSAQELGIFWAAFRKEMLQQWRTHRMLVVVAVFCLFGLTSPLLAYFMPQIIGSMPETQAFADLIPEPSMADAMGQYIKNMTQFGFILAVLLGMGAVAGEKEHGTTAMVLSKPMSRWAFVTSKFAAQAVTYLVGFLVAALGAYFYIVVLFGPFDFFTFLGINGLLFTWLMTFVAAALLGSVVGSSIGAAAGIGLAGAVVLLLAGSAPRVGPLFPSGLVGWATQLATQPATGGANAGALALAVVIILMLVLSSVGLFERQEL